MYIHDQIAEKLYNARISYMRMACWFSGTEFYLSEEEQLKFCQEAINEAKWFIRECKPLLVISVPTFWFVFNLSFYLIVFIFAIPNFLFCFLQRFCSHKEE